MKYMLKCSNENYKEIKDLIDSNNLEYSSIYDVLFISKSCDEVVSEAYISFSETNLIELKNYISKLKISFSMSDKLNVKDETSTIPLCKSKITYIYAGNNISYVVADKEYRINLSLHEIESRLLEDGFLRINKSEIINLKQIKNIKSWFSNRYLVRLNTDQELVVTSSYHKSFKKSIGL